MKAWNSTIVRYAVVALIAMLPVVVSAVEYNNRYSDHEAVVPAAAFQSTSTMVGSGSDLISTPKLNADGTVNAEAYGMGSGTSGKAHPGNPKTIAPVDPGDTPPNLPLGDGVWPLMAMAFAFCAYLALRSRKRKQA